MGRKIVLDNGLISDHVQQFFNWSPRKILSYTVAIFLCIKVFYCDKTQKSSIAFLGEV